MRPAIAVTRLALGAAMAANFGFIADSKRTVACSKHTLDCKKGERELCRLHSDQEVSPHPALLQPSEYLFMNSTTDRSIATDIPLALV